MTDKKPSPERKQEKDTQPAPATPDKAANKKPESGGPSGPEPTRYGDWERGGKCVDF